MFSRYTTTDLDYTTNFYILRINLKFTIYNFSLDIHIFIFLIPYF